MQRWLVTKGLDKLGPFTTNELQLKLIMGEVSLDCMVCREGGLVQRKIEDVPELFERHEPIDAADSDSIVTNSDSTRVAKVDGSREESSSGHERTVIARPDVGMKDDIAITQGRSGSIIIFPKSQMQVKTSVEVVEISSQTSIITPPNPRTAPVNNSARVEKKRDAGLEDFKNMEIELDFAEASLGVIPSKVVNENSIKRSSGMDEKTLAVVLEHHNKSANGWVSADCQTKLLAVEKIVARNKQVQPEGVQGISPAYSAAAVPPQAKIGVAKSKDEIRSSNASHSRNEKRTTGWKLFDTKWIREEISRVQKRISIVDDKLLKKAADRSPQKSTQSEFGEVKVDERVRPHGLLRKESFSHKEKALFSDAGDQRNSHGRKRVSHDFGRANAACGQQEKPLDFAVVVVIVSVFVVIISLGVLFYFRKTSKQQFSEVGVPIVETLRKLPTGAALVEPTGKQAPPVNALSKATATPSAASRSALDMNKNPVRNIQKQTFTAAGSFDRMIPKGPPKASNNREKVAKKQEKSTQKIDTNRKQTSKQIRTVKVEQVNSRASFKMGQSIFLQNINIESVPGACTPCRIKAVSSNGDRFVLVSPNARLWKSTQATKKLTIGLRGTVIKVQPNETWILLQFVAP